MSFKGVNLCLAAVAISALAAAPASAFKPGFEKPSCKIKNVCTEWRGFRGTSEKVCLKSKQVKICD